MLPLRIRSLRPILAVVVTLAIQSATPKRAAAACASGLCYFGGKVIVSPRVYLIEWGFGTPVNDPSAFLPPFQNLLTSYGGTRWTGQVTQYYQRTAFGFPTFITNNAGQFGGVIVDDVNALPVDAPPPPMGNGPTLAQWRQVIAQEALRIAQNNDTSANAIYLVVTPPRTNMPEQTNGACGWHGSIAIPGTTRFLPFADVPYQNSGCCYCTPGRPAVDNATSVLMHELSEIITDPFYDQNQRAWTNDTAGEIADLCGTFTLQKLLPDFVNPNTFAVPLLWSQAAAPSGTCVPSYTYNTWRYFHDNAANVYQSKPGQCSFTSIGSSPGSSSFLQRDVAVVSWAPQRLDVFVVDNTFHVRHAFSNDGGTTFGWDDWGAAADPYTFTKVSVASWGPFHLDVFALARGAGGVKNTVFHRMWNQAGTCNPNCNVTDTGWEKWDPGATVTPSQGPAAVSDSRNNVDVFVVDNQSILWHGHRTGSSGSPAWNSLGRPSTADLDHGDDLSVSSWGTGRMDVFARDQFGGIRHAFSNDAGATASWDDWGFPPSSPSRSGPAVIDLGFFRLNVYSQGNDGSIYMRNWDFGDRGWSQPLCGTNFPPLGQSLSGAR